MLTALIAAAVLAQASATPAAGPQGATPAPPAAAPAKPAKPEKPKLICHDEVETGSVIANRVCRTPEQIEAERQEAKRSHDAISDRLAACRGASC